MKLGWLQTKTKERVWFLFMKVVVMEVKFAQLMETMYQELKYGLKVVLTIKCLSCTQTLIKLKFEIKLKGTS